MKVSDIVFSNLRGDVPAKLGIRYEDLKHLNPAIVCCSLSGFGMTGPRSAEPGYDYVLQGMAGWMDITGEPDGPPTKSGCRSWTIRAGSSRESRCSLRCTPPGVTVLGRIVM